MSIKTFTVAAGILSATVVLANCGSSNGGNSGSSSTSSSSSSASSSSTSSGMLLLFPLPGRWQAQDYHNASVENDGRSGATDGPCSEGDVDLDATTDMGGDCFAGWTLAGEWLEFETASNSDARYDINLRLAATEPKKVVVVNVNGLEVGRVTAPANGWESYSDRVIPAVEFATGEHNVRVTFATGDVRLNYLELTEASSSSSSSSSSSGLVGYHPDITRIADIPPESILQTPANNWLDSYSVGDRCYCDSTFDHNIGSIMVDTPVGRISVLQACDIIGPGPGRNGRPIYNDIQCGNGPANDAGDEDYCPGRVDLGRDGCVQIGPEWNFD